MSEDVNQSQSAEKELFESSKPRDTLVGTTLDGRFYIEEVLGAGGMSVVYKARQLRVNRHVAIKTIRMQVDTKPVYRERFQREINSLCALSHPNIVTVYDCLIGDNDQPYVVMDYLRGRSLEALIKEDGPLNVERFARIAVQICSALNHAHRKGIIHRDLKPGNVVLMDDEMDFVKVVDFGLAKIGEESRKLTRSGELWGSPPYMSPEQCMGKSGDERSDIYSMGVVMYEMLTGRDPFHNAAAVFELIQLHINSPPPAFISVNPNIQVPAKLEWVVSKAMEKDPANRYQSADELQAAIVDACSIAGDRDSGDLLVHIPLKAKGSSGERSSGSYAEPEYAPRANAFDRALDPMAGEDLEQLFSPSAEAGAAAAAPSNMVAPARPAAALTNGQSLDPADARWRNPNHSSSASGQDRFSRPDAAPARLRDLDVPEPGRLNMLIPIACVVGVVAIGLAVFFLRPGANPSPALQPQPGSSSPEAPVSAIPPGPQAPNPPSASGPQTPAAVDRVTGEQASPVVSPPVPPVAHSGSLLHKLPVPAHHKEKPALIIHKHVAAPQAPKASGKAKASPGDQWSKLQQMR